MMDLVRRWGRLLVNRPQPFALQQTDGSYRWVRQRCDPTVLQQHLAGELTVAVSSLDAVGWWVCLDVDAADGLPQLVTLRDALALLGFSGIVEASRRGGHCWLLFANNVPASLARQAIQGVLARLQAEEVSVPPHELYPDTSTSGALGHAVRLPLGVHRQTGRRYPLLGTDGAPLAFSSLEGSLAWFVGQPRIPVSWLKSTWGPPPEDAASPLPVASATRSAVIRWVDAQVHPLDLLAEDAPTSAMRQVGRGYLGYCPFHADAAPQEDGSPGTPSFYVVQHRTYGWEWRCLSTNCRYHGYPMHHSFELFCALRDLDPRAGIQAAHQHWPEAGEVTP